MSIIYVLIPIAILLTAIGIYLFFWAVKTEQFDDLEKQGMSILFDDEHKKTTHASAESKQGTETDNNSIEKKVTAKHKPHDKDNQKQANK